MYEKDAIEILRSKFGNRTFPNIVFDKNCGNWAGYYIPPNNDYYTDDGRFINSGETGTIVLNNMITIKESTIVHEYRHHMQYLMGFAYSNNIDPVSLLSKMCWGDALVEYYTTSVTETDALLFEYKYARDKNNEYMVARTRRKKEYGDKE